MTEAQANKSTICWKHKWKSPGALRQFGQLDHVVKTELENHALKCRGNVACPLKHPNITPHDEVHAHDLWREDSQLLFDDPGQI